MFIFHPLPVVRSLERNGMLSITIPLTSPLKLNAIETDFIITDI